MTLEDRNLPARSSPPALLWGLAWALGLCGCGASVTFTPRAEPRGARPADCEVQVVDARPAHDWVVLGVLDLEAFSVRALPRDDEAFLRLVQPAVCKAGGDAVIAGIDGDGRYVLATVLAWVPPPKPVSPPPVVDASPRTPVPAPPPQASPPPTPAPPPPQPQPPIPAPAPDGQAAPVPAPPPTCPEGQAC